MDDLIKKKGGRPKGALTIPLAINTQKTKAVEYTLEGLEKLFQSLEKEFAVKESKLISDIASLDDSLKEKNKEVDKVNSILEKAEEDYIKLDSKISVAKNNVLEEEARIDKVKEGFASWKVQVVEEVARMKLKGKMANIDKAGLKEIING